MKLVASNMRECPSAVSHAIALLILPFRSNRKQERVQEKGEELVGGLWVGYISSILN